MPDHAPGCESCGLLMRQDTGYSNWTVMGTSVSCLALANPLMPLEEEDQSNDKMTQALVFGETCLVRRPGDPLWLDVDHEEIESILSPDSTYPKWQVLLLVLGEERPVPAHLGLIAAIAALQPGELYQRCIRADEFIENEQPMPKELARVLLASPEKEIRLQTQTYLASAGVAKEIGQSEQVRKKGAKKR